MRQDGLDKQLFYLLDVELEAGAEALPDEAARMSREELERLLPLAIVALAEANERAEKEIARFMRRAAKRGLTPPD